MSNTQGRRFVRRMTGASLSGVLAAGMMLAAAPVQAEVTSVDVTAGDIAPTETTDNYTTWHQGQTGGERNYGVTADGLSLVGKAQVIKGLATPASTDKMDDLTYSVTQGDLWLQIPMTFTNATNTDAFTTLRPQDPAAAGDHTVSLTDEWTSSRAISTEIVAHGTYPLGDILAAMEDSADDHVIAFGVFADTGFSGSVSSITWDDTQYNFKAAATTSTTVDNADVRVEETSNNYTEWHQGYADATGRQQVTANGLELAGRSQVIKGYSNNSTFLNAINANLQFVLPEASYTVENGSDNVYFQIPLRFDNGSGVQFATLRNTGAGAGINGFGLADSWQSSKSLGSLAANTDAPLADIIAALGDYKVIGFGVLTNEGDTATVSNVTFNHRSYDFEDAGTPVTSNESVQDGDIAPDESTYAGWHQGSTGAATVEDDVLNLGVEKSQVINGYADSSSVLNTGRNVNLRTALTNASYTVDAGVVHFQVPMFVEDPTTGVSTFATLRPAAPAEVGANTISIQDEWVSSKTVGSVTANTPVLLGDILSVFKTYKVIAFGVFSDAGGNGVVEDITWDGVKYDFFNATPVATGRTVHGVAGVAKELGLFATDAEGDPLTFEVATQSTRGNVTIDGTRATFTPSTNSFVGTTTFTFTASDASGTSAPATVTIDVAKARSRTAFTLSPTSSPITTGSRPKAHIKVTSTGRVNQARVNVYDGSTKVGTGRVDSAGRATVTFTSKLTKGTHTIKVKFVGTSSTLASQKSMTLKITK